MRIWAVVVGGVLLLLLLATLLVLAWQPATQEPREPAPAPANSANAAPPARPIAPQPVDLGAALGLDSLRNCERGNVLDSILERMVRIDPETFESRRGSPIEVPGFSHPLVPTFERNRETGGGADIREVITELDLPGVWHGLRVTGLRRSFYEESDASAFEVLFAEAPGRVRDVLISQGFRLPAVGESREVNPEEMGMSVIIGVGRTEGGASLTCATG
jgi:hypothetical protein